MVPVRAIEPGRNKRTGTPMDTWMCQFFLYHNGNSFSDQISGGGSRALFTLAVFHSCRHKSLKQGVGVVWPGFEFRVCLRCHKPRM